MKKILIATTNLAKLEELKIGLKSLEKISDVKKKKVYRINQVGYRIRKQIGQIKLFLYLLIIF